MSGLGARSVQACGPATLGKETDEHWHLHDHRLWAHHLARGYELQSKLLKGGYIGEYFTGY